MSTDATCESEKTPDFKGGLLCWSTASRQSFGRLGQVSSRLKVVASSLFSYKWVEYLFHLVACAFFALNRSIDRSFTAWVVSFCADLKTEY